MPGYSILITRYWILDAWLLNTGYSILVTGYWLLDAWVLNTGYSILEPITYRYGSNVDAAVTVPSLSPAYKGRFFAKEAQDPADAFKIPPAPFIKGEVMSPFCKGGFRGILSKIGKIPPHPPLQKGGIKNLPL
jgi:hypothetical protein